MKSSDNLTPLPSQINDHRAGDKEQDAACFCLRTPRNTSCCRKRPYGPLGRPGTRRGSRFKRANLEDVRPYMTYPRGHAGKLDLDHELSQNRRFANKRSIAIAAHLESAPGGLSPGVRDRDPRKLDCSIARKQRSRLCGGEATAD